MEHGGTQVVAALLRNPAVAVAEAGGNLVDAVEIRGLVDVGRDGLGLTRHREGGELGLGVVGGQRGDGRQTLCQRLGDFVAVAGHPDPRAVDARAPAVDEHRVDQQV